MQIMHKLPASSLSGAGMLLRPQTMHKIKDSLDVHEHNMVSPHGECKTCQS